MTDTVRSTTQRTWYFTFGFGQCHPRTGVSLANCYTTATGTYESARARVVDVFGVNWSFQYETAESAGVDRYNLTYVMCTHYEPGELLPPTAVELKRRSWALETVHIIEELDLNGEPDENNRLPKTGKLHDVLAGYYPTLDNLVYICRKYGIPSDARVEYDDCESHTLVVSWDHTDA